MLDSSPGRSPSDASSGGPIVVFSDLHFGEPDATLAKYDGDSITLPKQENTFDTLFGYLKSLEPIEELLLLGDTFEIWRFPWSHAVIPSKRFFSALQKLDVRRVGFTYGNHDHPLLFQFEYWDRTDKRGRPSQYHKGSFAFLFDTFVKPLFPDWIHFHLFCFYPFYARMLGNRVICFHHGHYLKYLPLTSSVTSLINGRFDTDPGNLREIEQRWTWVFWGSRYLGLNTRRRRKVHDFLERNYIKYLSSSSDRITRAERSRPASWVRNSDTARIANYAEDVRNIIRVARAEKCSSISEVPSIDIFLFGHTHYVGTWRSDVNGIPSLVNIGCWTAEKLSMPRALNTFAVVYEDRIELLKVVDTRVELLDSLI